MDQPPPRLGQVEHPGVAAAAAALSTSENRDFLPLGAQLLYGYLLADMTGSEIDYGPYGTTMMPGSTLRLHTVLDHDDRGGLPVFTSQAEIQRTRPPDAPSESSGMVHPADTVFQLAESMGLEYVVIDPGSSRVVLERSMAQAPLELPHDVGMRAALELGADTRRTVLEGLAQHDGPLFLAANPESMAAPAGADGSRTVQLRTTTAPTGGALISVYTSAAEVALRHAGDSPLPQTYDSVIAGTLNGPYAGLMLNPGSSWIILTRAEVQAAARRRAKLADQTAKAAAKAAARAARGQR